MLINITKLNSSGQRSDLKFYNGPNYNDPIPTPYGLRYKVTLPVLKHEKWVIQIQYLEIQKRVDHLFWVWY